ncbi:MAG: site-2 protease family protein [Pirellulaceae bacterium]|nr:site-2 protease family protein [Pirellulaceae bacterium]
MGGSLKLGRIAGIDLKIHWTFFLLLLWVGISPLLGGGTIVAAAMNLLLIVAVFACVVAHEYGHALAARRYGIATQDITLLPIGGVARLREIPKDPIKELVVAIAGPAVNVVIAIVIGAALIAYGAFAATTITLTEALSGIQFWQTLMAINVFLVLFNAIPAFPMDGGRVLRALLALRMDRVRATDIAASIGQTIAIGFGVIGLFGNPLLILIAFFIYFGARGEAEHVRRTTLIGDLPVRAAMIANFIKVGTSELLDSVRDRLLEGMQQDFPVMDERGFPVGMLYRSDAIEVLRQLGPEATMEDAMTSIEKVVISPSDSLQSGLQRMQELNVASLPVAVDDRLVGLLTQENIWELLMFRQQDPSFGATTAAPESRFPHHAMNTHVSNDA